MTMLAALPDLVIYLGPGVGLALVAFLTVWIRRRNRKDDIKPL